MAAKIVRFFESIGSFFYCGDGMPRCNSKAIAGFEKEVAEGSDAYDDIQKESMLRLSWGLIHSRHPEDVQRGIAILEDSLNSSGITQYKKQMLYLLAVGHYRSRNYSRSRYLVEQCFEITPDWGQCVTLKKKMENKIARDGLIGIGITATSVGLVVGGIAAAMARKK